MNIWTGLLFLEGAVADATLAHELAGDETRAASPSVPTGTDKDTGFASDAESRHRSPIGAGLY